MNTEQDTGIFMLFSPFSYYLFNKKNNITQEKYI